MQQPMFAIVGGTLWGNRGAEAMVVTTIGRLRERHSAACFLILSYYAAADRRLAPDASVRVDNASPLVLVALHFPFALLCWLAHRIGLQLPDFMLPGPVRRLRRCSALFDVSGISFHDGRLAIVAYNLFCIWPALLLGVPVVHLSQAMGPFSNPLNRMVAKRALGACYHTFARGRITAEHMSGLGLPEHKWSVAADVAFSFKPGDSITRESDDLFADLERQIASLKGRGTAIVGLSPSSVVLQKTQRAGIAYLDQLAAAVAHLQGRDYHVLVLPNAIRAGAPGGRNNDLYVIQQLRAKIEGGGGGTGVRGISWVTFDLNTDAIRKLVSKCDLLITSRFHAMVAGLALCVPTLVIGWSHKYQEVLEMFGCEADAIDFANLDLRTALDRAIAEREDKRTRIREALPQVTASSLRQFQILNEIVK